MLGISAVTVIRADNWLVKNEYLSVSTNSKHAHNEYLETGKLSFRKGGGGYVQSDIRIVNLYGATAALVHGRILSFSFQSKEGVCTASLYTIAEATGLKWRAVNKSVKLLLASNELEKIKSSDGTSGLRVVDQKQSS